MKGRWQRAAWLIIVVALVGAMVLVGWWRSPQHRFQEALDGLGMHPVGDSFVLSEFGVCLRIDRMGPAGAWQPVAWSKDVDAGSWYDADPFEATAEIEEIGLVCVGTQRLAPVEIQLPDLPPGEYQICEDRPPRSCVPVHAHH